MEVVDGPLAAAKLGDTVLAAQAFQHDADLVFSREMSSRRTTAVLHAVPPVLSPARISVSSSLLDDEPEILPSSTRPTRHILEKIADWSRGTARERRA